MEKIFVGVDGGGTKTKVIGETLSGVRVIDTELNGLNINQLGVVEFEQRIIELYELTKIYDVQNIVIGMPGYGESRETDYKIKSIVSDNFVRYYLLNDVAIAQKAALNFSAGIHVVAGTGSMVISEVNDKIRRCGGFGPLIGDEGSAYYIGFKLINMLSRALDGRSEASPDLQQLSKTTGLETESQLIDYVYNSENSRVAVAKLSAIVDKCAANGNVQAQVILTEATDQLTEQVMVLKKLEPALDTCSFSGSVFKSHFVLNKFITDLNDKGINVIKSKYSPEEGALLFAIQLYKEKNEY